MNLGKVLIAEKLITLEQLQEVQGKVAAQKPLHEALLESGFLDNQSLARVCRSRYGMPCLGPDESPDPSAVKLLSRDLAHKYQALPLRFEEQKLRVALCNPFDVAVLDDLRAIMKLSLRPVWATKLQLTALIQAHYRIEDTVQDLVKNMPLASLSQEIREVQEPEDVGFEKEDPESASVVQMVRVILAEAARIRATDIHIEPFGKTVSVRCRIDGYLKNVTQIPMHLYPSFTARIKILAGLNIAEKRKPQDGRIRIMVGERRVDLRVNLIPVFYGEKIAIRILDPQEAHIILEEIGFEDDELQKFRQALQKPGGIVLVTGPTGSGKTSTLYAALNFLKKETNHIITVEDPIEYLIDGVNQVQLNSHKDVTFASSLRSILRQDPDVIFIGEIRDRETADIAFRASQTGHVVLSTLHTNDSIATVSRLFDIGLEPYLVGASLSAVVAQRLVRLNCPHCKERYWPEELLFRKCLSIMEGFSRAEFYRGAGCSRCNFSGYFGRTAIVEIMNITDPIRTLIKHKGLESQILLEARKQGFHTLAEAAAKKAIRGLTTLEEISCVLGVDAGAAGKKQRTKAEGLSGPLASGSQCDEVVVEVL